MLRFLFKLTALAMKAAVVIFLVFLAGTSNAGDVSLKRLDTGDDSRGWEAVGRLNIGGYGFCTGSLIAPDVVLTAAHCLYDKRSGDRVALDQIEFRAGWRNGRASAYRGVRRVAVHPDFDFAEARGVDRIRNDIALLQLDHPVRNTTVTPFATTSSLSRNDQVSVVSYAKDRAEAPSLQRVCTVMGQQNGVYVMSCDVDFGASGAPVFQMIGGEPQIVSLVAAKSKLDGKPVAVGINGLEAPLQMLQAELAGGKRIKVNRVTSGADRARLGAKFVSANGG